MPGLRIAHYLIDFGYNEPTRIYAVVEKSNGDLKLEKILQQQGLSFEDLTWWWNSLDIKRPIVLAEYLPQLAEHLKLKGIRVR